jgi:hypothetical protein
MRGDEHVWKREQTCELVVVQNLPGQVLEEDAFLFLVHVECHSAETAGFQLLDQRLGLDECFISSSVSWRIMWYVSGVSGVCNEITSHSRASVPASV